MTKTDLLKQNRTPNMATLTRPARKSFHVNMTMQIIFPKDLPKRNLTANGVILIRQEQKSFHSNMMKRQIVVISFPKDLLLF
jgi:hypothetical protein